MRPSIVGIIAGLLFAAVTPAFAQEADFAWVLRFEGRQDAAMPRGWGGGPRETIFVDTTIVYDGAAAARLERGENAPNEFSTITKAIPIDFEGEWIELRGYLRTEGVTEYAGLWMREDGPGGPLQFDNMQRRQINGTTDWTQYSIRLPLDPDARDLYFGVLIAGEGIAWADELEILVDGESISEAPPREYEPTVVETDHEFDDGSDITTTALSDLQVEHLTVLGRVWGFLKYHHPAVAGGEMHWDYELLRVLPDVLDAADRASCNRVLSEWVARVGMPDDCSPCARPPEDVHLLPRVGWIDDAELLGRELSDQLQQVYKNRFRGLEQFYLSLFRGVRNPIFENELPYADHQPPDAGFRVLGLFRYWNMIEYWFPYRNQIDDEWPAVLEEFLPRFAEAKGWDAYRLEFLALISRVRDTHANLQSAFDVRPPRGECHWPVAVRFVEGRAAVADFTDRVRGPASGLQIGDVISAVDGTSIDELIETWSPYYSASNGRTRLRDIATSLPRGPCGESRLTIERLSETQELVLRRQEDVPQVRIQRDRRGETFQLLSPDVAYIKLSGIAAADVDEYVRLASDTRGLVIDIRNYPSDFVVFRLGSRLVTEPTEFARFTVGDISNPGAFTWTQPLTIEPVEPAYGGKVAILVNEVTISSAEYTAMALRASPNAVVVGSTTAGADGNVSRIALPGGLRTLISGIGVFYPDKTPTQRVGIVPDIHAEPTLAGIREGRDEVLEAALRHILGPEAGQERIIQMARPDSD